MKRVELCFILIMMISLLCGCANPNNNSNESAVSSAAASLQDDETPLQIPSDTTEPESNPLNIEYGRFYNRWDEDYVAVRAKIDDYMVQMLRNKNLHFKEDVENGIIPEVLQLEYCGNVYDLKLNSEKYKNTASWFCPQVSYLDKSTGLEIDVDAETLGERCVWLRSRSLAKQMHNESTNEKKADELLAIAQEYMEPRLAKLNLKKSDYQIVYDEPYEGQNDYFFSVVSNDLLLGKTSIASIRIDFVRFHSNCINQRKHSPGQRFCCKASFN